MPQKLKPLSKERPCRKKSVPVKTENIQAAPDELAQALLHWFQQNGRDMPWRVKGRAHSNPYAVWISEIMLQQTTVKTVESYFKRWMERFPDITTLANADIEDVLLMWQGLGYYTRARKIHECARVLVEKYNGVIPAEREALLKLPGIGPYSASSICAFAFNKPETVVDGNVIRVIARLYGLKHAVTKEEIYALASKITPLNQGADYASAIMDLGAIVCTPASPLCAKCPWNAWCVAYLNNLTSVIPLIQKPTKKVKKGFVYIIQNERGDFYIEKRREKGLLNGLYEFPWQDDESAFPLFKCANWQVGQKQVSHTFTHFSLTLKLVFLRINEREMPLKGGVFCPFQDFKKYPFSTLMQKVAKQLQEATLF